MLLGLPYSLYYELTRRAHVSLPSILIACMLAFSAHLALTDRKSDRITTQISLEIAAYMTATLQVAFNEGELRAIPLALFFSAFRIESAIRFLLPIATAIIGATYFANRREKTHFRIIVLSLIASLLTITNTRWAMGLHHQAIYSS